MERIPARYCTRPHLTAGRALVLSLIAAAAVLAGYWAGTQHAAPIDRPAVVDTTGGHAGPTAHPTTTP